MENLVEKAKYFGLTSGEDKFPKHLQVEGSVVVFDCASMTPMPLASGAAAAAAAATAAMTARGNDDGSDGSSGGV